MSEEKQDKRRGPWSPERKAKWAEMVKRTNDKPAGGGTANGGGDKPGAGDGWGGPPRGIQIARPLEGTIVERRAINAQRKIDKEVASEEMRQIIYELAHSAERQETRLSAAQAMLNRFEGLPTARIAGMSDEAPVGIQVEFVRVKGE